MESGQQRELCQRAMIRPGKGNVQLPVHPSPRAQLALAVRDINLRFIY